MAEVELAVVVVSYNTCDLLRGCLRSVYAQRTPSLEVWVVDNASADGSPDMVRREFPEAHLLAQARNLGFAAGNNVALRAMGFGPPVPGGDQPSPACVLFLNPDTELTEDALTRMMDFLRNEPRVGVVGPSLTYPDGSFQHSAFAFPDLWQIWFDFFAWPGRLVESRFNGRYPRAAYQAGIPFAIDHPLGAAMLARAEVIRQVGLMDESFFMYAEEIDWCIRVKRQGWQVYCVPAARIVHHSGSSTQQNRSAMRDVLWQSRFRLFRKHYSPAFNLAAHLLVAVGRRIEARRARALPVAGGAAR